MRSCCSIDRARAGAGVGSMGSRGKLKQRGAMCTARGCKRRCGCCNLRLEPQAVGCKLQNVDRPIFLCLLILDWQNYNHRRNLQWAGWAKGEGDNKWVGAQNEGALLFQTHSKARAPMRLVTNRSLDIAPLYGVLK